MAPFAAAFSGQCSGTETPAAVFAAVPRSAIGALAGIVFGDVDQFGEKLVTITRARIAITSLTGFIVLSCKL
jgi:hypothetical protein